MDRLPQQRREVVTMNAVPNSLRTTSSVGRAARWLVAWLLVWLGLAIWQAPIITSLPYEDQSIALWTEADFLVDTNFDFYRLRYHENHFMAPVPGARSYVISVLPSLLALLMIVCPNVQTLVVTAHLINLACTAFIVVLVYAAAREWTGKLGAALTCLVLLTTPLFDVQVQMVGMDIPLATFTILAATLLWRHQFVWAAVASQAAFFMKATGGLITMTGLVYLVGLVLLGPTLRDRTFRRQCLWGIAAHLVALLSQTILVAIGDESVAMRKLIPWPWILRLPYALVWSPDVAIILIMCSLASLFLLLLWLTRSWQTGSVSTDWRTTRDTFYQAWVVNRQLGICWTFLCGMLLANWMYIFIPRYFTSAMPFLVLALAVLLYEKWRAPRLAPVLLMSLIALNLVNLDGKLYPPIYSLGTPIFDREPLIHPRSCAFTERSREYLLDHEANIQAMQLLDTEYPDSPVLIAIPQRYYLMKPRLGYVSSPRKVLEAETFADSIRNFRNAMLAVDEGALEPILYWTGRMRSTLPPPEPGDDILFQDDLEPPLIVYRKRFEKSRPQTAREWEDWYLDKTWPNAWSAHIAFSRANFLVETGRLERALDELNFVLQFGRKGTMMDDLLVRLRDLLLVQRVLSLAEQGDLERASLLLEDPRLKPSASRAIKKLLSQIKLRSKFGGPYSWRGSLTSYFPILVNTKFRFAEALSRLLHSSIPTRDAPSSIPPPTQRSAPASTTDEFELGVLALFESHWSAAREHFVEALQGGLPDTDAAMAHLAVGMIHAQLDQLESAESEFFAALQYDPMLAEVHNQLGLVRLQNNQLDDAQRHFQEAVRIAPLFADAYNNLGTVEAKLGRVEAACEQFNLAVQLDPLHRTAKLNRQATQGSNEEP